MSILKKTGTGLAGSRFFGDGRKNMPSSTAGYQVYIFKQAQRLQELSANSI